MADPAVRDERIDRLEQAMEYAKPPGVAILVGLFVLSGVLSILAAFGVAAGMFAQLETAIAGFTIVPEAFAWAAGVLALLGILSFVAAWGLSSLRSWAWGLALVLAIVGLFLTPWSLLLGILMIVYLSMYDVRVAFRGAEPSHRGRRAPGRYT